MLEFLPIILSVAAAGPILLGLLSRVLFLVALGLAFIPRKRGRMIKLLEILTPLLRRSRCIGPKRVHEQIAILILSLLAMFDRTDKTARQLLKILER